MNEHIQTIYSDIPNPSNLLEWLDIMLDINHHERSLIIDKMLLAYQETLLENNPQQAFLLNHYLDDKSGLIEFKHALNNINLLLAMTFIAQSQLQYEQAVRRILLDSRKDSMFSQQMKLYYLHHLKNEDFSHIVLHNVEQSHIIQRLHYFEDTYLNYHS